MATYQAMADAGVPAAMVHVADAVMHGLDLAGEDDSVARVAGMAWEAVGSNEEACPHLFRETEGGFGEMTAILIT